jgi:hypothetical protein
MEDLASQVTVNLMLSSPNYIVFFVGFILCIQRWQLHPRISLILACGLMSLSSGSLFANIGLPVGNRIVQMNGGTPDEVGVALGIVRAIAAVPYAIGFALMLYAALTGRQGSPRTTHS